MPLFFFPLFTLRLRPRQRAMSSCKGKAEKTFPSRLVFFSSAIFAPPASSASRVSARFGWAWIRHGRVACMEGLTSRLTFFCEAMFLSCLFFFFPCSSCCLTFFSSPPFFSSLFARAYCLSLTFSCTFFVVRPPRFTFKPVDLRLQLQFLLSLAQIIVNELGPRKVLPLPSISIVRPPSFQHLFFQHDLYWQEQTRQQRGKWRATISRPNGRCKM